MFISRLQGAAIITFLPTLANTTITLSGLGQLSIGAGVSIFGPDEGPITINAVNTYRALYVETGSTVFLQNLILTNASANTGSAITVADNATVTGTGLTIRNSAATQAGGGVYVNSSGLLRLINSQLYGNTAVNAGGAVYADVNSTVTLDRVTLYSNSATGASGDGGAIYSLGAITATQVTAANNVAGRFGGAFAFTGGTASLLNSTVASNVATGVTTAQTGGAGIYAAGLVTPTLRNSIVARNVARDGGPADVSGTLSSDSGCVLIGTGAGGVTNALSGNQVGTPQSPLDPRLMPLGMYGGTIPTMPPRTDSPVIDAGLNSYAAGIATDPAGGARIRDFNKDGNTIVDIGAYEARPIITVTSTLDEATDTDGLRSLREAVAYAATGTGLNVIQVSPALFQGDNLTLSLGLGPIDIEGVIGLDGPAVVTGLSTTRLTLSARQLSRHFNVSISGWLMLSNLTLSQGLSTGDGGSILNSGRLDLASILFWSNKAQGSGGAVASSGTLTSVNTTFSSNSATGSGGSLYVTGGSATVLNSTFADSVARSQNTGVGTGGNVAVTSGTVSLTNSIVTGGRRGTTLGTSVATPNDVTGVFTGGTYNFVSVADGSIGLTGIGSIFGSAAAPADPKLTGLSDNSGPTLTYGVLPGSPVVDAGIDTQPKLLGLTTDARALPRYKDGNDDGVVRIDIGAFEQQVPLNQAPTLSGVTTIQGAVQDTPFTLRYETLLAASNANDPEGAPIRFLITSLDSGSLTIDGQAYYPGILFGPGQTLVWTPPTINFAGQRSVQVQGFSVEAFDGQVPSRSPVPVNLQVVSTAEEVNYAVLFSGGDSIDLNYANYYDNIKRTYQTLVTRYGVLPANIYVIYADGTNAGPDQRGNINSDLSFAANVLPATRDNLRRTLMNIGALADANDHFFLWTFDHGLGTPQQPSVIGEEVLRGWGDSETIGAADLRVWLQGLSTGDNPTTFGVPAGYTGVRAGFNTYVFGQCFAGGMLAPLKTGNNALGTGTKVFGVAAANHYEASYADYFIGAYTDALDAGYNNTLDAYNFAYSRDGRAARGEQYAPNAGTWQYNVEHPFALGDTVNSFPIFATPRNANGVPTVVSVTPLKVPSATTDLTVTYEMLSAAINAIDPGTQNFGYRISNVGSGSLLTTTGLPIDLNNVSLSTISLGESFVYRRPAGSTGTLNDLVVRVIAADGTPAISWTTLPVRVGGPASGAVAVNDSTTLQFNTVSIPINVLGNDLGTSLRVDRLGIPSHGTVRIDAVTGQVTYTPPVGYVGSDSFSYILKDASNSTDIGNVTINVVSYDPSARTTGAPNYTMTELGVPPSWAGLPLDNSIGWTAAYRNSIPPWIASSGVDIDDQGRVLVRVARDTTNYQPGSFVEYVGGTVSTYIWSASSIAPYWNWSVSANATDTNAILTHYLFTGDSNPHAGDGLQHAAVYGLDASLLGTSSLQPARLLYNGDNANSTGQPSFGVLIQNPGQIQNAGGIDGQDVVLGPEGVDILPVDISPTQISAGVSLVLANDRSTQTAGLWSYNSATQSWSSQPLRNVTGAAGSFRAFGEDMLPNGNFVGTDSPAAGTYLAFSYDYTTNTSTRLTPLSGDTSSAALAVNSSGTAVGVSATSLAFREAGNSDYRIDRAGVRKAGSHAVRWVNGVAQSLGTLASDGSGWSVANDINDSGVIVGSSNAQAFIYIGGAMYNLNALITNLAPGTVLVSADSINSLGQIVATETATLNGQQVTRAVFLDLASSLQLQPDNAATSAQGSVVVRPLDNDRGASYLTSIDTTTLRGAATLDPLTNTITYNPAGQFNGVPFEQFPITTRLSYTARDAFGAIKTSTISITVNALSTFNVTNFLPTSSGFTVTFNSPPSTAQLNLYSGPNNIGRLPDLTLVDNNSSPVIGSFLKDSADGLTWRFVARGGALTAPSYTLTLASRTDGFTSSALGLLDGNFDNTPGGNYVKTFSPPDLTAAARQVTLGYIARAPGQAINSPATTAIPLTLINTSGVRGISFNIRFDPALLSLTALTPASTLPGDWSITSRLASPGVLSVALSGVTALPSSTFTLATLLGSVPSTATAFAASSVRVTDVSLNEGALPATGDDSVLVAALPGDADASGDYSNNDTTLINRVALGTDSGLDAYPLIDPQVIADVTANGATTPFDASQVAAVASGAGSVYIGALPGLSITASSPINATTSAVPLSALASYAFGESAVTYSWSLFNSNLTSPSVTFSVNGSNAARSTVATFSASGSYVLRVAATTPDGRTVATQVQVGVVIPVPSPGAPVLAAASDTGVPGDNLTNLNNASTSRRLTFTVPNTVVGATVNLYAGTNLVGSAVATGTTTTVVSNGSTLIPDGTISFSATQIPPSGTESAPGTAALVTIDTQAPTVSLLNAPSSVVATGPSSLTLRFSKPVTGLNLGSLSLTRDAASNLLTSAQAPSSSDQTNWTLSSLSSLTALPGAFRFTLATSGITDLAGNPLPTGLTANWVRNTLAGTAQNDTISINFLTSTTASIVVNTNPAFSLSLTALPSLIVTAAGGSDTLSITGTSPLVSLPLVLSSSLSLTTAAPLPQLTVTGTGTLVTTPRFDSTSLSIDTGATLRLTGTTNTASTALAITIALTGVFDVGTSTLIARNASNVTALRSLLSSGLLKTTATSPLYTTLSLFTNITPQGLPYFPSFNSVTGLNPTDVIIKFTYIGDVDLDGLLTGADYKAINEGLLFQSTGWQNGDIDNSGGPVNSQDWNLFTTAYQYYQGRTQTPLGTGASDDAPTDPPLLTEPAAPTSAGTTSTSTPSLALTSAPFSSVTAGSRLPKLTVTPPIQSASIPVGDLTRVSVRIHDGPATGRLLGTTTVPVRRGIASFSNLSIRHAGTYSLEFLSDGYLPALTLPFTVTPAAASKLALSTSPIAPASHLPSPPTVSLTLQDTFGNTVTDSSSYANLSILARLPGARPRFSTRAIFNGGTATFDNLPLTTPGDYLLTARSNRLQAPPTRITLP